MGHTVIPMRWVIYDKITQLRKLAKALREPERSIANSLLYHVHQNISAITYANPLPSEIENNMIFAMLVQEKMKKDYEIENLTLLCFAMMVEHKMKKLETKDSNTKKPFSMLGTH